MKFDIEYLEDLANILYDNDLSELSIKNNNQTYSLKRNKPARPARPQSAEASATVTSQVVSEDNVENNNTKGRPITSPMVGTFYDAPSPNDSPFVEVGDMIAKGQVICIVEAMKLMNEIEAEASGRVTEICVKNGDSVEIGQVLMYVE